MLLPLTFILLVAIIFASYYAWLPVKKALEDIRYAMARRVVIFMVTFVELAVITLFILANSIYIDP